MRIVKENREWQDEWRLLADDKPLTTTRAIIPLDRWLTESPAAGESPYGLLVQPDDELGALLAAARRSPQVAIDVPSFNDARCYSFAD